jgi:hypothetical protein
VHANLACASRPGGRPLAEVAGPYAVHVACCPPMWDSRWQRQPGLKPCIQIRRARPAPAGGRWQRLPGLTPCIWRAVLLCGTAAGRGSRALSRACKFGVRVPPRRAAAGRGCRALRRASGVLSSYVGQPLAGAAGPQAVHPNLACASSRPGGRPLAEVAGPYAVHLGAWGRTAGAGAVGALANAGESTE